MKHRIEFIGLPGSGKSSLYSFAHQFLVQHYPETYSLTRALRYCEFQAINLSHSKAKLLKKAVYILADNYLRSIFPYTRRQIEAYSRFVLDNPNFVKVIYATLGKANMSLKNKIRISNWFFAELSAYQMIEEYFSDDEILLLDEGYCHRSVSFIACDHTMYSAELLDNYFKVNAFMPDILFFVKRNPDLCLDTLRRKTLPDYFATLSSDELYERYTFLGRWLEDVVNKASSLGAKIIEVENTGNLAYAKRQIEDNLKKICR